MTIKEIAELCGVDQSTVWRWAKESACKMQAEKLETAGHGKSADFTLEETIAIIGEGGGNKTLAALLTENATNKDTLAIQRGNNPIAAQFAGFAALMGKVEKLLDDPKKAAYEELEAFVKKNLEVDEKRIYKVPVWHLYRGYTKIANHALSQHEFMFKIALDHPEFELTYKRKEWAFIRCYTPHFI